MGKFLKNLFTEPDNQTFCPIRLVAVIGVFQYFGLTTAHYIQHGIFAPQEFALGIKKDTPKC